MFIRAFAVMIFFLCRQTTDEGSSSSTADGKELREAIKPTDVDSSEGTPLKETVTFEKEDQMSVSFYVLGMCIYM